MDWRNWKETNFGQEDPVGQQEVIQKWDSKYEGNMGKLGQLKKWKALFVASYDHMR